MSNTLLWIGDGRLKIIMVRRTKGWSAVVHFPAVLAAFAVTPELFKAGLGSSGPQSSCMHCSLQLTYESLEAFLSSAGAECFPSVITLFSPPEATKVKPSSAVSDLDDLQIFSSRSSPAGLRYDWLYFQFYFQTIRKSMVYFDKSGIAFQNMAHCNRWCCMKQEETLWCLSLYHLAD